MKKRYIFILMVCVFIFFVLFESIFKDEIERWFNEAASMDEEEEQEEVTVALTKDIQMSKETSYIGWTTAEIIEKFGEPERRDLTPYGYVWWIYSTTEEGYVQIGVMDDKVVTAFHAGEDEEQTYEQLNKKYDFEDRVEIKNEEGVYEFELTSEDLRIRPLVKESDYWIQFYFDSVTGTLSSVRMMTAEVLLLQRPYSVTYRGPLPKRGELSQEEWNEIEKGEARQIFDLTNIIRARHDLEPLEWAEDVAHVAYLHSKEMSEHNYFSHQSPISGELQDRFEKGDISFKVAGENIAAQYVDGLAAVEGWLNSEGHRVNLLHETFTHLGVGVHRYYYTQNFMIPFNLPHGEIGRTND